MRAVCRGLGLGVVTASCFYVGVVVGQQTPPTDYRLVSETVLAAIDLGNELESVQCREPRLCAELATEIRQPGAMPLDRYEEKLRHFLQGFCHRDTAAGWHADKRVRDTGPYIETVLPGGTRVANYFGTHNAVVIWYSPE